MQPNIVITRLDAERLESLLENLSDSAFPGKEQLLAEILRADVVEPDEIAPDVVTMNSTVRFRIERSAKEFSLKLVYPKDSDGSPEKISVLAPVGTALLGIKEGHTIAWPVPGGSTEEVRVIKVEDQPERTGNYSL